MIVQHPAAEGQRAEAVQRAVIVDEGVPGGVQRHAAALHQPGGVGERAVQHQIQRVRGNQFARGVIQRTAVKRDRFCREQDTVVVRHAVSGEDHGPEAGDAAGVAAVAVAQGASVEGQRVAALDQPAVIIVNRLAAQRQRLLRGNLACAVVQGLHLDICAVAADQHAALVSQGGGIKIQRLTCADHAAGIIQAGGGIKNHIAAGFQRAVHVEERIRAGRQRLLRSQLALAVIQRVGGEIQRAAADQHALLVINVARREVQRAAAADAAGGPAVAVGQRRAVGVQPAVACRLNESTSVVQRAAVEAQLALREQRAGGISQDAAIKLEGSAAGNHLSRRIIKTGGIQRQRACAFQTSLTVTDRAAAGEVRFTRRSRNQPVVVVQGGRVHANVAAGCQRTAVVIQPVTNFCVQAAVLRGYHLPAPVIQRLRAQGHVTVGGNLPLAVIQFPRQIQRQIAAAGLHEAAFLVGQGCGLHGHSISVNRAAVVVQQFTAAGGQLA